MSFAESEHPMTIITKSIPKRVDSPDIALNPDLITRYVSHIDSDRYCIGRSTIERRLWICSQVTS